MPDLPALDVLLPVDAPVRLLAPRSDEAELIALFADDPSTGVHVRANMVEHGRRRRDRVPTGSAARSTAPRTSASSACCARWRTWSWSAPARSGRSATRRSTSPPSCGRHARRSAVPTRSSSRSSRPAASCRTPCSTPTDPRSCSPPARPRRSTRCAHVSATTGWSSPTAACPAPSTPARSITALADRGLVHVLAEGGPTLLAQLVDADLVDELCLTWSPQLVGGPAGRVTHLPTWFAPARAADPGAPAPCGRRAAGALAGG